MAKAPAIRPVRETLSWSGVGGFLHVSESQEALEHSDFPPFGRRLEVQQWLLWHRVKNVRLPMSGGFGAVGRRRVSSDFDFVAEVDMDANQESPFFEDILEGIAGEGVSRPESIFQFQLVLQCGDPTFYNKPELQSIARVAADQDGVYYRCNSVMLEEVHPIVSTKGDDVVRAIIKGSGSSPLRRYVNDVWEGAGVYRIAQDKQGHQQPDTGL